VELRSRTATLTFRLSTSGRAGTTSQRDDSRRARGGGSAGRGASAGRGVRLATTLDAGGARAWPEPAPARVPIRTPARGRGWHNVTADHVTRCGVTLWSSAGHNVTCGGATFLIRHVWQTTDGAFGLVARASPTVGRPARPWTPRSRRTHQGRLILIARGGHVHDHAAAPTGSRRHPSDRLAPRRNAPTTLTAIIRSSRSRAISSTRL
jgi:hypothetical protein